MNKIINVVGGEEARAASGDGCLKHLGSGGRKAGGTIARGSWRIGEGLPPGRVPAKPLRLERCRRLREVAGTIDERREDGSEESKKMSLEKEGGSDDPNAVGTRGP